MSDTDVHHVTAVVDETAALPEEYADNYIIIDQ